MQIVADGRAGGPVRSAPRRPARDGCRPRPGGACPATIEGDEHGTEAAAATAVVGDTSGGGHRTEVGVTLDRPFIYLIRDGESGEILFAGRVLDPAAH